MELTTITILRDPVERTLSYLRHCKRHHEQHRDLLAGGDLRGPVLLSVLYQEPPGEAVRVHGRGPTRSRTWTCSRSTRRRLELAKANLDRVDVVGTPGALRRAARGAARALRLEPGAGPGPQRQPRRGDRVADSFRRRIAADNEADMEFYEFARELCERRRARGRSRERLAAAILLLPPAEDGGDDADPEDPRRLPAERGVPAPGRTRDPDVARRDLGRSAAGRCGRRRGDEIRVVTGHFPLCMTELLGGGLHDADRAAPSARADGLLHAPPSAPDARGRRSHARAGLRRRVPLPRPDPQPHDEDAFADPGGDERWRADAGRASPPSGSSARRSAWPASTSSACRRSSSRFCAELSERFGWSLDDPLRPSQHPHGRARAWVSRPDPRGQRARRRAVRVRSAPGRRAGRQRPLGGGLMYPLWNTVIAPDPPRGRRPAGGRDRRPAGRDDGEDARPARPGVRGPRDRPGAAVRSLRARAPLPRPLPLPSRHQPQRAAGAARRSTRR